MKNITGLGIVLLAVAPGMAHAQLRVTSATPTAAQIQAGGSAISLTLDGQQLSAVTSVRGLLAGQPVAGLKGALTGPAQMIASGATRLTVALTADRSVPSGSYQVELVAGTQRVLAPVSITVRNALPQPIDQPVTGLPATQPKAAGTVAIPTASVTGATPALVTLRAGGPAQTVVLSGSLLNQVVGAYVQQNGNRVLSGFRVELLASADPARREVRISAYGTTGPWGVPLDLMLEHTIGSTPVRAVNPIATPVKITAAAPPSVDLSVGSCTFDVRANAVNASTTIRNSGLEGAAFQTNQVLARITVLGKTYQVKALGGGMFIPAGGSANVTSYITEMPAVGTHAVTWTADPEDLIAESNAFNNSRSCTLTVAAPPPATAPALLPDLFIPGMTSDPNSGPSGTKFVFRIKVQNVGAGDAPRNTSQLIDCRIDGGIIQGTGADVTNAPYTTLKPGQSIMHELRVSSHFAPGAKKLECTVDSRNLLVESTETNNKHALLFTVTSK